jgi:hypothetical protein
MTTMPADQLEAILLHELAHIRRNDFLINLLQSLAETMFFFNPFVWLLSARIREERELCCDDLVVEHLNPLPYARALARLPEAAANGRLVLAATGNKKKLFNRIKRIIEMKKQNSMNGRWGLLAATLLVAVSVAVFTPSFAQKRKKKQASSTTTYVYKYITADSTGKLSRVKTITGNNPVTTVTTVDLPDDGTDGNSSRKSKTIVISKSGAATAIAEADDSLSFNLASLGKELESLDLGDLQLKLDDVDRDLNNLNIQVKGKKKHATISISASINDDGEEAIADVRKTTKGLTTKTMTIAMNGGKKALTVSDNSGFDDMISDLEKEGLLDRKGNFNISSEKGELYINGVKQAKNVTARYKLDGDAKINISGNRRNLSVSIEK